VLITSQSAAWPRGEAVEVPVLDAAVAAGFLVNRTGDADEEAAEELAGELGGLPLALEQGAAYIQATGDTLAGYLSLFRDRRADLLARGQAAGHPADVAATLGLALSRLGDEAPAAVGLLRLLACCAPEPVPWRLLLTARPGLAGQLGPDVEPVLGRLVDDRLAAADAVAALRRYSLVSPVADGLVLVHRLVQAVTAGQMPADLARQWRQAAAALVGAALPADSPWLNETWPDYAMLLPHVQAAAPADSAAAAKIADYLGIGGNYRAARASMNRVLEARKRTCGPEDPDTRRPAGAWPTGSQRRAIQLRPATSWPRWCRWPSGCSARSTRTRCGSGASWPCGPAMRAILLRPATSGPRWCPCASGCSAPSTAKR